MLCYTFTALGAWLAQVQSLSLLDQFPIERNAHGAEQESGILVSPGAGVESDMATGDHLGRVPR